MTLITHNLTPSEYTSLRMIVGCLLKDKMSDSIQYVSSHTCNNKTFRILTHHRASYFLYWWYCVVCTRVSSLNLHETLLTTLN